MIFEMLNLFGWVGFIGISIVKVVGLGIFMMHFIVIFVEKVFVG